MHKIKVMAIAPYEGLVGAITSAAVAYKDKMELTAVEGNLNQSLVWAVEAEKQGYDVIISRGGTAELLLEHTKLPVISIDVSGYDYIRTLKLADNIEGKKAFVGFPSITRRAESVNTILKSDIRIFTIQSYNELEPLFSDLNQQGYSIIIGDVAACRVAKEMAMNAMLLTSGTESIVDALEQALLLHQFINSWREQVSILLQALNKTGVGIVIVNAKARIIYSNPEFKSMNISNAELAGYLGNADEFREQERVVQRGNCFFRILTKELKVKDDCLYYAMYFTRHTCPDPKQTLGIKVYNFKHRGASASTLLHQKGIYDQHCISMSASFSEVDTPYLITGDIGVGKISMAMVIHRLSKRWNQPFVKVNCHHADPVQAVKSFCLNGNADINLSGGTMCFEAIDVVNLNDQSILLEQILSLEGSGWRFAATTTNDLERLSVAGKIDLELYRYFSQLVLFLPGLKDNGQNLKNIVNLYIIEANTKYGKQVTGMTTDAMNLIVNYKWSQNFTSLRQAVTQMVLIARGDYITLEEAKSVIRAREPVKSTAVIDLNGTLDEIMKQVILKVLEEEKGNQTRTAARLGISRSTLWRKISDSK